MNTKLISRGGVMPSGGFPFVDPRTNHRFDGFDAGGFGDQVLRIIKHRLANPRLYPASEPQWLNVEDVSNELDTYQCQRLGGDERFCGMTDAETQAAQEAHAKGVCRFCGGHLEKRYCPTCGNGQMRVIGFRCLQCGSTLLLLCCCFLL